MLLSIFVLIQILVITSLVFVYITKSPILSTLTMVSSAILAVGAWTIEFGGKYVWDPSIRAYVRETLIIQTPYLPIFNMMIFGLALLYFFGDLFDIISDQRFGNQKNRKFNEQRL